MPDVLPLALVAALLAAPSPPRAPSDSTDDPRAIVRAALAAVEADSAARLAEHWEARRRRNPNDRAAAFALGTLARLTYDAPRAEQRFRELYAAGAPADRFAAYARLGHGQLLYAGGSTAAADSLLATAYDAARRTGDRAAEAEALLGWTVARRLVAGSHVALALVDSAARLVPPSDVELTARRHCLRAQLLVALVRREALAEIEAGLAAARRAGARRTQAQCLRARADYLEKQALYDSALVQLREVVALQRGARERQGLVWSLVRTGVLSIALGHFGEARRTLGEVIGVGSAIGERAGVASGHQLLGVLALRTRDHATATEQLARAVAVAEAAGDQEVAMYSRAYQADVLAATGDVEGAMRQLREVADYTTARGAVMQAAWLRNSMARILLGAGELEAAEREIAAARDFGRRHGLTEWADGFGYELGLLALRRGELAAAEARFRRLLRYDMPAMNRFEVRARLAEVHARRGDLQRAERELASASDDLDAWRATLPDADLRTMAFQSGSTESDDVGDSVAEVIAALAGGGRADAAFRLAERRRARELADRLVQADAIGTDGAVPDAVRERARRVDASPAAAVAAAIPDDATAVVEYVARGDRTPLTLFVVTRRGVRARALPAADSLAARIGRLVAQLESGGDPRALERALGAELLDPALSLLAPGVERLVIIPDGPLHRLPFDALRLADGRYVAERYVVSLAPSATVARVLWQDARTRRAAPRPAVLALGDPRFAGASHADAEATAYRSAFQSSGGLPRLAASGREARLVARFASRGEARLGEDASEAFLKRARLDSFAVLHLATHALVDDASLARTAIALAPGEGEDGFLTPGDLAALRLNADLVVLSACRTAGGRIIAGEGVQGLTAPLLQAGARAVMATSWRIGDRSAVAFVEDLYGAMAEGRPVADALRAAKLAAIRRGAPPAEWAAFTVVGDPLVTVPLRAPPPARWWWLAAGLGVAALGAALMVRRRRSRQRSTAASAS